jgi:hypothetical protein
MIARTVSTNPEFNVAAQYQRRQRRPFAWR